MHGVTLMTWNNALAEGAQRWADTTAGEMRHSKWDQRRNIGGWEYVGENLMLGATDAKAVDGWYNEIRFTNGGRTTQMSMQTGHYTQVVWRDSVGLGCGVHGQLLVCWYGPGGNGIGQFSEQVPPPSRSSSECPG
mmetsp:Transcript_38404/g.98049  ORF Transcript_38404/g.98049 Transcript_38404/m.98049 type:complete len:135 (-) Transcript_38404:247-651(-)